jgi:transcriptional regulator with XRE-family HTH domain
MDRREMKKGDLAGALGVDRSVASRYLSRSVRAPLTRLQYLQRSIGVEIPQEIVEAYWLSEGPATPADVVDVETMIRSVGAEIEKSARDSESRAKARSELQELLRKLA